MKKINKTLKYIIWDIIIYAFGIIYGVFCYEFEGFLAMHLNIYLTMLNHIINILFYVILAVGLSYYINSAVSRKKEAFIKELLIIGIPALYFSTIHMQYHFIGYYLSSYIPNHSTEYTMKIGSLVIGCLIWRMIRRNKINMDSNGNTVEIYSVKKHKK